MEHGGFQHGVVWARVHPECIIDESAIEYLLQSFQQENRSVLLVHLRIEARIKVNPRMSGHIYDHLVVIGNIRVTSIRDVLRPFQFVFWELFSHGRARRLKCRRIFCVDFRIDSVQLLQQLTPSYRHGGIQWILCGRNTQITVASVDVFWGRRHRMYRSLSDFNLKTQGVFLCHRASEAVGERAPKPMVV